MWLSVFRHDRQSGSSGWQFVALPHRETSSLWKLIQPTNWSTVDWFQTTHWTGKCTTHTQCLMHDKTHRGHILRVCTWVCAGVALFSTRLWSQVFVCFSAPRAVQTDAHSAAEEEKQTQTQTSSTSGSHTTRWPTQTCTMSTPQLINMIHEFTLALVILITRAPDSVNSLISFCSTLVWWPFSKSTKENFTKCREFTNNLRNVFLVNCT